MSWHKNKALKFAAAVTCAGFLAAACSSSSKSTNSANTTPTTAAVQNGGTITSEIDETIPGWNVNTSADNEYVLQEIENDVLPQAYIVQPDLTVKLNTDLLTSATETSTNPQTITYKINPKAVWSDGTPINALDFIYNWQALSGNSQYTDLGGKPYDDAGTTGYNQIKSVTGSDPANGAACDPGSAADRDTGLCPNGDTVTVVFSTPFADWQSLFGDIIPAHKALVVGWNTGFNDYTNLLSGSWYEISSYTKDQSVVLTKNPSYWGKPAIADKVVFQILASDDDIAPALKNNELQVMTSPQTVDTSLVNQIQSIPNLKTNASAGLEFDHLDFNESNKFLAMLPVREAIAYGTDRKTIISRTVGQIDPNITPVGNHMYLPGQPQYVDDGTQYETVNDSMATQLLTGAGFTKDAAGYYALNGQELDFTISSTTGNSLRQEIEQLFQSEMQAIGIKITIQNYPASTLFGTNLPNGEYQIALFAWVDTPFATGNNSIYCSYTNTANCGQNWIHFANAQEDQDLTAGATATSPSAEAAAYNAADKILWSQMATLPLFQVPQYVAWASNIVNVVPNTSSVGLTWNMQDWGIKAA